MTHESQVSTPADQPEISGSRLFDAPRERIFDAFSSPEILARWWGPTGFTLTTREMSFAPGGVWRFVMHGPDGRDYPNKIVFLEIAPPDRIVYRHPGDDGAEPVRMETTVALAREDEKTRVNWRMRFETRAERDRVERDYGAAQGLAQTLARLDEYFSDEGAGFRISRRFDAPREQVWKALTVPERMARWWGPKGLPVLAAKMDLRPGGSYHYGLRTPDGQAMWGRFDYCDIEEPWRIVLISAFSNESGGVTRHPMSASWPLETLSIFQIAEEDGRATLTIRAWPINASKEERATFAGASASLTQGWSGTLDQLADFLVSA
jgi:uncharacterized protein YndB with AHSA1/START domain